MYETIPDRLIGTWEPDDDYGFREILVERHQITIYGDEGEQICKARNVIVQHHRFDGGVTIEVRCDPISVRDAALYNCSPDREIVRGWLSFTEENAEFQHSIEVSESMFLNCYDSGGTIAIYWTRKEGS
ncbi:hypothetical protein [Luteimonas terricola]|uniref:hypothetical protein n=1 Tax=Luteimonas terricola TaxID=645597 RepID=UPI00104B60CB|nr:hypothetical protein [Luteimonas terricola]